MSAAKLGGFSFTLADVADLAPRIRESDRLDCAHHAKDAGAALIDGVRKGPCWGVTWDNVVIGALGWTSDGYIWSLWADLTPEQSKAIMSRTTSVVKALAHHAKGRPLGNVVRVENRLTIAWLRASKCFEFGEDELVLDGDRYLSFFVKPLGEL